VSSAQNFKNDKTKCFSSNISFYPVHCCNGKALEVYTRVELLGSNLDRTTGQFDRGILWFTSASVDNKGTKIRDSHTSFLKRWPVI
jgi:hypothetical protein